MQVLRICGHPGSGAMRLPTAEDIAAMTTVSSIILETLRLYPAVPQISRVATADVVLQPQSAPTSLHASRDESSSMTTSGRLHVRKGTGILIPIAALHRDRVSTGLPVLQLVALTPHYIFYAYAKLLRSLFHPHHSDTGKGIPTSSIRRDSRMVSLQGLHCIPWRLSRFQPARETASALILHYWKPKPSSL
jgi:hypothetical protein